MEPCDQPDIRVLRTSKHTTRRDRLCHCGRVIPAGARYERTVGTEDGKWFDHVQCAAWNYIEPCQYPFPAGA